jgi:enoyl-[acyl-carrier-protein] reductase (NADH)
LPNKGSKDSLAWAIAKKIEEEGTTIWKAGGSDLVSGIFNEALQQSIEADFANLIASEISSEIINIAA